MSHIDQEGPLVENNMMEAKAAAAAQQKSWWARQTGKTKIIIAAVAAAVVIGLAVGLGVGLTIGRNGGDDEDDSNPTFSATPSPGPTNVWQPAVNSSWQIVLLNPLDLDSDATSTDPDVEVWDIDMYTNSKEIFGTLKKLKKKIICYFSAGSYEDGRPDSGDFNDEDKGKELDGWPGEYWLDLNSANVRKIMKKRIEYAAAKGCDAIDPDNVDGYTNKNGLGLTKNDSINFVRYLSSVALPLNLSMGLKNAGGIIPDVLDVAQFSVNEQCVQFGECATFAPFVQAAKPVFNIEYPSDIPSIKTSVKEEKCGTTGQSNGRANFSTVMKNMNLNGWVEYCDGSVYNTTMGILNTTATSA